MNINEFSFGLCCGSERANMKKNNTGMECGHENSYSQKPEKIFGD